MRVRITIIIICLNITILSFAQTAPIVAADTSTAVQFIKDWEKDFLDVGISIDKDSFHVNNEARKLLLDSQYRLSTYPQKYTWPDAISLLNKMELKKAFWFMMNLYKTDISHKELALQTFVLYDSLVDMEKILINTFYTYSLTDPEVCFFKNGKTEIRRPDILEAKFANIKEIIAIVKLNRKPATTQR